VETTWLDNVAMQSLLPTLQIAMANNEVVLQWPASASAFTLQTTPNVDNPSTWTTVANAPTVVGTKLQLTLPPSNQSCFFRLKWQQP